MYNEEKQLKELRDRLEPIIKDSGERREFESGAVRDVQEGKGRCDLLPLKQCAEWFDVHYGNDDFCVLEEIYDFMTTRNKGYLYYALNDFIAQKESGYDEMSLADIILDVSKHYEEGAKKYEERNWEKGIPLHAYIDSGVRHFLKCMAGWNDEPHNRAFIWNMLGAIWTLENKPEFDDLPKEGK